MINRATANPMSCIHIDGAKAYAAVCRLLGESGLLPGFFSTRIRDKAIYQIPQHLAEKACKIDGVARAEWSKYYR